MKAQIKLRFMTATKQPVVIIRSFQLTQARHGSCPLTGSADADAAVAVPPAPRFAMAAAAVQPGWWAGRLPAGRPRGGTGLHLQLERWA